MRKLDINLNEDFQLGADPFTSYAFGNGIDLRASSSPHPITRRLHRARGHTQGTINQSPIYKGGGSLAPPTSTYVCMVPATGEEEMKNINGKSRSDFTASIFAVSPSRKEGGEDQLSGQSHSSKYSTYIPYILLLRVGAAKRISSNREGKKITSFFPFHLGLRLKFNDACGKAAGGGGGENPPPADKGILFDVDPKSFSLLSKRTDFYLLDDDEATSSFTSILRARFQE